MIIVCKKADTLIVYGFIFDGQNFRHVQKLQTMLHNHFSLHNNVETSGMPYEENDYSWKCMAISMESFLIIQIFIRNIKL